MRISGILFFMMLFVSAAVAQTEPITFSEKTYDFGDIRQNEGPFVHEFIFTNPGADTVTISGVKTSCGCTTPYWTSTPVAPGDSGKVQAEYSADRLGTFHKSLNVRFSGASDVTLHIQGKVLPSYASPVDELTAALGNLHMKYRSVNMGKVKTLDTATTKTFAMYNNADVPLRIDSIYSPAHAVVTVEPVEIPAKSPADLIIRYDAKANGDLGFHSENITLFTSDSLESVKSINLYATVAEYFPPMSEEEVKHAPHLLLEKKIHDFDRIRTDSSYSTVFTISNVGQSPLEIRKVAGNCACIVAEIDKTTLKPGKSTDITVTFNTDARKGNQQKTVTVYSNDPTNPEQRFTVKAYIPVD